MWWTLIQIQHLLKLNTELGTFTGTSFKDSNTTLVKVKYRGLTRAAPLSVIQIQHLLKLNLVKLEVLWIKLDSNTTLVKVKSLLNPYKVLKIWYSNTTLVKVKF